MSKANPLALNLYERLDVAADASQKEIKQAYLRAALALHPDKAPKEEREQATRLFQNVVNAWDVLKDEETRRKYDRGAPVEGLSEEEQAVPHLGEIEAQFTAVFGEGSMMGEMMQQMGVEVPEGSVFGAMFHEMPHFGALEESEVSTKPMDVDAVFAAMRDNLS